MSSSESGTTRSSSDAGVFRKCERHVSRRSVADSWPIPAGVPLAPHSHYANRAFQFRPCLEVLHWRARAAPTRRRPWWKPLPDEDWKPSPAYYAQERSRGEVDGGESATGQDRV